jgi:hypothetical protein
VAGWVDPNASNDAPTPAASTGGGGGWSDPNAPTDGGGWVDPNASGQAAAPAHKGGGGILGSIGHFFGTAYHNTADLPIGITKGLIHLGGEAAQTVGVAPNQIVNHFEQLDPFYHPSEATQQSTSSPGVNALFGNAAGPDKGDKGLHVFAQQSPTLYQSGAHLEKTAQGVPDIVANEGENLRSLVPGQPAGPGLANSIYGQRIHNEGVLGAGLSTAGDVAMLAGGVGMAGDALGVGNLATASKAEGLAAKAVGNAAKGDAAAEAAGAIKTSEAARAAAQAARDAGNVSKAAEYESAATNLAKAEAARAVAAGRGSLGQAAERVTAGAKTVTHFGNQVANAPAELYTKAIPKLVNLIPGVDTAAAGAKIAETVGKLPVVQAAKENLSARSKMKDLMGRSASEEQRLLNPMNSATAQINTLFKGNRDAEVAAYLSRTGDAATTLRPLAGLPDAEIQRQIDATPAWSQEGVTPAAVKMAVAHVEGTLPAEQAARFDQAHGLMEDSIYGPKAERHVTGFGDKAPMNPIKQAGREANVAGEPAPLAVGKLEDRLTAPLDRRLSAIDAEVRDIRQRNLDPQTGELSPAAQKQIARDEAVAKSIRRQVQKEEARQAQVAKAAEAEKARVEGRGNNRIGNIAGRAREQMETLRTSAADVKAQALRDQAAQTAEATNNAAGELRARGAAGTVDTTHPGWYLSKSGAERARLGNQAADVEAAGAAKAAGERAQAEQVEPTKVKGTGKVQQQTNRAAGVANARTAGESTATERLTVAEAGRQESALQRAQRQLAAHEETAGARAERLTNDAAARAFRNDQNRLSTLDEQRANLEAKRQAAVESAPNHPSVQAPQVRSLLSHASAVAKSLLKRADELEPTDPALAAHLRAAAEAQPKGVADLRPPAPATVVGRAADTSVPEGMLTPEERADRRALMSEGRAIHSAQSVQRMTPQQLETMRWGGEGAAPGLHGWDNNAPLSQLSRDLTQARGADEPLLNRVRREGQINEPVTINSDTGHLMEGHTRYLVAKELGLDLPVRDVATSKQLSNAELMQLAQKAREQAAAPKPLSEVARYIRGGESPEETARMGKSAGQRMRSRQATGNETARTTDWAPLTANGQQALMAQDIAKIPRNELPRMVQHELGDTAANVATEHGLKGEALAAHLAETAAPDGGHWVAWDPEGSGGELPAHRVTADSPVISSRILDTYQKWNPSSPPHWYNKVANAINDARMIKLLGSGFVQHKALADMMLNQSVAGVGPIQSIKGALAAHSQIKAGVLPPDISAMPKRVIEPGEGIVGKAKNIVPQIKAKGMAPFRALDTHNRVGLYNTLSERGYSPQTTSEMVKLAAGDLQGMNPATKAAARAVFTYAPWQLHLAQVAKNIVAAHPAGLAEGAAIAQADKAAHPGQQTKPGELSDIANPFGSFILAPSPKSGQSMGDAVGQRIQQSINPLLETGAGALAGVNLHKGQQVTTPSHPFGSQGAGEGPLIMHPGDLGNFMLRNLVPQVGQIQDVVGRATGPGGFIPYRQDTGQPEAKKGTVQAQPDTTRADAIARLLGYPHAEKPAPPKKAKRGR